MGLRSVHWATICPPPPSSPSLLPPPHQDANGYTPLHLAVIGDREDLVALLLTHHAHPSLGDSSINRFGHVKYREGGGGEGGGRGEGEGEGEGRGRGGGGEVEREEERGRGGEGRGEREVEWVAHNS